MKFALDELDGLAHALQGDAVPPADGREHERLY
jgi:hypothetical protein